MRIFFPGLAKVAREDAFRSLNYATYFISSDGQTSCCGKGFRNPFWFSDGYSDYLRHFNWVMGAIPELAPVGQDHLLRSSSVVRKVQYSKLSLRYSTFAGSSTEVLRLSYAPLSVRAGNALLLRQAPALGVVAGAVLVALSDLHVGSLLGRDWLKARAAQVQGPRGQARAAGASSRRARRRTSRRTTRASPGVT